MDCYEILLTLCIILDPSVTLITILHLFGNKIKVMITKVQFRSRMKSFSIRILATDFEIKNEVGEL